MSKIKNKNIQYQANNKNQSTPASKSKIINIKSNIVNHFKSQQNQKHLNKSTTKKPNKH